MKFRTILATLLVVSLAFTSCQSKGEKSADKTVVDVQAAAPDVAMPDITLERTDGTKLELSSLFGKTLFLDFWATWCPPCCREIPFLQTLAGQFADNKDLRIISISLDQDREAWVKKVAEDNPTWEQYRICADEVDDFFSAIELETIPRFIIVGPDGSIINADAPRPSDESCVSTLQQAIE